MVEPFEEEGLGYVVSVAEVQLSVVEGQGLRREEALQVQGETG
jgi:hypothetical protein